MIKNYPAFGLGANGLNILAVLLCLFVADIAMRFAVLHPELVRIDRVSIYI